MATLQQYDSLLSQGTQRSDTVGSLHRVHSVDLESASQISRKASSVTVKAKVNDPIEYDMFLSHLQRNAQNTVIAMNLFLKEAHPSLRTFIDLEIDMAKRGGLSKTLHRSIRRTRALIFFITKGIFESEWCVQEMRWAVEMNKVIVLVLETDERHGGIDMKAAMNECPEDLQHVLRENIAIPW